MCVLSLVGQVTGSLESEQLRSTVDRSTQAPSRPHVCFTSPSRASREPRGARSRASLVTTDQGSQGSGSLPHHDPPRQSGDDDGPEVAAGLCLVRISSDHGTNRSGWVVSLR
jgi:hypothetical protein